MPLSNIYYILLYISAYHEDGVFVSSYVQPFALAYRVELRPVMPADNLSVRVVLVAGLLDMLLSAPVSLSFKIYVVFYRLRQS